MSSPPPPPGARTTPPDNETIQRRLGQLEQERAALEEQLRVIEFTSNYSTQFAFPAVITWANGSNATRTDPTLIQHRLLEAGILYDVPVTVGDTVSTIASFVQDLEATQCFKAVRVELGGEPLQTSDVDDDDDDDSMNAQQRLTVILDEAKWYNLFIGGGLKNSSNASFWNSATNLSDTAFLPTAELEARLALRNLAGCLDSTLMQYSLDTHNIATYLMQHVRPLYKMPLLPAALQDYILELPTGSQYLCQAKVLLDTADSRLTRSFQEYQRLLSLGIYTNRSAAAAMRINYNNNKITNMSAASVEWNLLFRDLIPQRHPTLPYQFAASPQVVSLSGPSVKHSILATWFGTKNLNHINKTNIMTQDIFEQDNSTATTPPLPTSLDYKIQTEVAFPPGDVGFVKSQVDVGIHVPITTATQSVNFHLLGSLGILKSLQFGGLTRPAGLSDRFLLGGPVQFRGFSPSGIGPRTFTTTALGNNSNTTKRTGDALGGDFLYKVTGILSAPAPLLQEQGMDISMFAFGQIGTCAHCVDSLLVRRDLSVLDVLKSSRASVGVGLATHIFGPRLELTYAIPLRYGPMDHRRNFQVGMGFTMGG